MVFLYLSSSLNFVNYRFKHLAVFYELNYHKTDLSVKYDLNL